MVNYNNGKIYRLISVSGKQYVGSTTQNLAKRKSGHVRMYNAWLKNKEDITFTTSFTLLEEGDVDIVLIEEFPCENKEQLLKRERYWIETIDGGCVNKIIPTRTKKQYYEANKEQVLEKAKQYYQQNKDRINVYNKQYYEQYYEANKKQRLEKAKQYYEENKEQILKKAEQYYEANKEQVLEKVKQYREANKEQILEKAKQYYEANKDNLKEKTECPCGGCFSYYDRRRHERTIIHQDYIKNIS